MPNCDAKRCKSANEVLYSANGVSVGLCDKHWTEAANAPEIVEWIKKRCKYEKIPQGAQ